MQTENTGFTALIHHNPNVPWVVSSGPALPLQSRTEAISILQQWASEKGLEIMQFERCFFCGRFAWWTTSRKQIVFCIKVCDDKLQERSGWVRFGNFLGGGYADSEPDVIWNE